MLTLAKRRKVRQQAVNAALRGAKNAWVVHYTQGGSRWEGINNRRTDFPRYADCSSFTTWALWLATRPYGLGDFVNAANWQYGYTGSQTAHGKRVTGRLLKGDLVFYGWSSIPSHVAMYIGGGKVVSHGSERGPLVVPLNYRRDVHSIRRYVR